MIICILLFICIIINIYM